MTAPADTLRPARGPQWRNRMVLAPLTNTQSHPDGTLSTDEIDWLVARARGGFAVTMTAAAYVTRAGNAWPGQLGIADEAHLPALSRLAAAIRAEGGVSAVQLHHGGRRADPTVSGEPRVGAYDDPETGSRALTTAEVGGIVRDFASAARRAQQAGFDGVELHGAHGYLLCQFLDPVRNTRTDGYGADRDGRARIIHEVITAVRDACGDDLQLGLRLSPERHGVRLPDMVQLAAAVMARGDVDYLDLSLWDVRKRPHEAEPNDERLLIDHFTDLPRHGTALAVAGAVTSGPDVQWCLDRGADAAIVGKAAMLDHAFAAHVVADPDHRAPAFPTTREHLRSEFLGEAFVDYFASTWPQHVRDATVGE